VRDGLEALRQMFPQLKARGEGVVLIGDVGVTNHFGDILRRADVPSRIQPEVGTWCTFLYGVVGVFEQRRKIERAIRVEFVLPNMPGPEQSWAR